MGYKKRASIKFEKVSDVASRPEFIRRVSGYKYIHTPRAEVSQPMYFPTWFAIMHEEIHDELGHPMGGAGTREEAIRQEEEVWKIMVTRLKAEDQWNKNTKKYAIASLANYMQDRPAAIRYIESL